MDMMLAGTDLANMSMFVLGLACLLANRDLLRKAARGELPREGERYRLGLTLREHSIFILVMAIAVSVAAAIRILDLRSSCTGVMEAAGSTFCAGAAWSYFLTYFVFSHKSRG